MEKAESHPPSDRRSSLEQIRSGTIKCGWVKKRIKYNIVHPYAHRYLCLTPSSILYFHSDTEADDETCADCKIPLSAITDLCVLDTTSDPEIQDIELVVNSGTFITKLVFQCMGVHEGTAWTQAIMHARDQYIAATAGDDRTAVPVTWKRHVLNKRIVGRVEKLFRRKKSVTDFDLLTEEQICLLMRFGTLLVSDRAVMGLVVEAALDALSGRHAADMSHVDMAKKLGQAVAMWLGGDGPDEPPRPDTLTQQTEAVLLEAWLTIALHRELKRAYLGEGQSEEKQGGGDSAAAAVGGGDMKMPFRGDNCESVFLANFVKGVALKSGTLSDLLQSIVLEIASSPDEYNGRPAMARSTSGSSNAAADAAGDLSPKSVESEGANGKLHVLSTSINDVCSSLFETVATSYDVLPGSLSLLIKIIYEISLDISAPPTVSSASKRDEATIFYEAADDNAERLFCTASCGLLFLRLLCPALISPLEWGALRDRRQRLASASISSDTHAPKLASRHCSDADGSAGGQSSFLSSVMGFLTAGPEEATEAAPAPAPTVPLGEIAWVDPSDEDATCSGRSAIDIGSSSAALVIMAHALAAAPDVLRLLDLKLERVLGSLDEELLDDREEAAKKETSKLPKRRSDPIFSLSSIKHMVHARTWSQPTPVDPELAAVTAFEAIVYDLKNALPLSKADEMIQLHYVAHASLVDPNTEKVVRSPPVRKALVNVAKNVQRVANASCVPESQLESYIAETDPQGLDGSDPRSRLNHNFMLSSAVLLKRMYRSIAGSVPDDTS